MSALQDWIRTKIKHNIHYSLDLIYREWVENMHDKGSDEKFIMCKESMRKRLAELAKEDNPCIGMRKCITNDKNVYFKKEERIVPVKTNRWLSKLGQKAMKLYPNPLKWWR